MNAFAQIFSTLMPSFCSQSVRFHPCTCHRSGAASRNRPNIFRPHACYTSHNFARRQRARCCYYNTSHHLCKTSKFRRTIGPSVYFLHTLPICHFTLALKSAAPPGRSDSGFISSNKPLPSPPPIPPDQPKSDYRKRLGRRFLTILDVSV